MLFISSAKEGKHTPKAEKEGAPLSTSTLHRLGDLKNMRGPLAPDSKVGKNPSRRRQPIRYSQPSRDIWDSSAHCQEQMKSLGAISDPARQTIPPPLLKP